MSQQLLLSSEGHVSREKANEQVDLMFGEDGPNKALERNRESGGNSREEA